MLLHTCHSYIPLCCIILFFLLYNGNVYYYSAVAESLLQIENYLAASGFSYLQFTIAHVYLKFILIIKEYDDEKGK